MWLKGVDGLVNLKKVQEIRIENFSGLLEVNAHFKDSHFVISRHKTIDSARSQVDKLANLVMEIEDEPSGKNTPGQVDSAADQK